MTLSYQFLRRSRLAYFICLVMVPWTATSIQAQAPLTGGGHDRVVQSQSNAVQTLASFQGYANTATAPIRFELRKPALVHLEVYNRRGQHVQTLTLGWFEAGMHEVGWDARAAQGGTVSNGAYFVRLRVSTPAQPRQGVRWR